jgi:type IV pilus biogenesis protein CpaD/CtpE
MHCHDLAAAGRRAVLPGLRILIAAFAATLAGCMKTASDTTAARQILADRHPITMKEGAHAALFVGAGCGGFSPTQQAEVLTLPRAVRARRPAAPCRQPPAAPTAGPRSTAGEVLSIMVQAGVPIAASASAAQ